jgi:hypothetical protein
MGIIKGFSLKKARKIFALMDNIVTKASRQSLIKPFMALFSAEWHGHFITRTHLPEAPSFSVVLKGAICKRAAWPANKILLLYQILIFTIGMKCLK